MKKPVQDIVFSFLLFLPLSPFEYLTGIFLMPTATDDTQYLSTGLCCWDMLFFFSREEKKRSKKNVLTHMHASLSKTDAWSVISSQPPLKHRRLVGRRRRHAYVSLPPPPLPCALRAWLHGRAHRGGEEQDGGNAPSSLFSFLFFFGHFGTAY